MHFKEALKLYPAYSEASFYLGKYYYDNKNYGKAEQYMLKAAVPVRGRICAYAYNALGVLAIELNEYEKAKLYFTEALKIKPGFKIVKNNLDLLQKQMDSEIN